MPPMGFQVVLSVQIQRFPTVKISLPGIVASRSVQGERGPDTRSSVVPSKLALAPKLLMTVATQILTESCPSCKSTNIELSEQDIVDYLALIGGQTGTKIEVIAGKAEHGVMLGSLGKIAAILRYNPNFS